MNAKEFIKNHPRIYERALECYKEQSTSPRSIEGSCGHFINGFTWSGTREEDTFWEYIKNGNFDVFYEKYPEVSSSSELSSLPEKWIPKVDDWVVITKSNDNWASEMDTHNGRCVKITHVRNGNSIEFDGSRHWSWCLNNKHFRKALPHEIPTKTIESKQEQANRIFIEKGFDQIKKGDLYLDIDGDKLTASRDAEIRAGDLLYIDCGASYLWSADSPDKFGSKVEKVDSSRSTSSISKWSPGTFVLMLKNNPHGNGYLKGAIATIKTFNGEVICYLEKPTSNSIRRELECTIKWFATKAEAEQYWILIQSGNSIVETVDYIDYDSVLEEAKKRYPIGARYYALNSDGSSQRKVSTVQKKAVWYCQKKELGNKDGIDAGIGYIYLNGKWAEIISETKPEPEPISKPSTVDQLIEKAKRDYPVGTKFIAPDNGNTYTVKSFDKCEENNWFTERYIVVTVEEPAGSGEYLFQGNKWAEIVERPEESKTIASAHDSFISGIDPVELPVKGIVSQQPIAIDPTQLYGTGQDFWKKQLGRIVYKPKSWELLSPIDSHFWQTEEVKEKQQPKSNTTQLKMLPVKKIKVRNNQNN